MKKFYALLLLFITFFSFNSNAKAEEFFEIQSFDTYIDIHEDGKLTITEAIEVNFSEDRHGIFRDIQNEDLPIKILSVTDENNKNWPYQEEFFEKGIRLRIGDANKYVNQDQTYRIQYEIQRAIRFFDTHDELYWNSTGNAWPVPIVKSKTIVKLPPSVFKNDPIDVACFTGTFGSTASNCEIDESKEQEITYYSTKPLRAYEGMSVVLGLPKGTFPKPTIIELNSDPIRAQAIIDEQFFCTTNCSKDFKPGEYKLTVNKFGHRSITEAIQVGEGQIFRKNFELKPYFWFKIGRLIMVMISITFAFQPAYIYWKKGRDPEGRSTLVTQYEPPDNLSPIEINTLINEKVVTKDITASIVDLAVRGYLDIKLIPKSKGWWIFKKDDYELIKNEPPKPVKTKRQQLDSFEQALISAVFGKHLRVKISSLVNEFYVHLNPLKEKVNQRLVDLEYFPEKPQKTRNTYLIKGFVFIFVGLFIVVGEAVIAGSVFSLAIVFNGLLSLVFSNAMPQKTTKGVEAKEQIMGFKHYLEIAEKDRLKFQEKSYLFYKFLPYAMTLGIVDQWSKAFKGILSSPPDWYHGPSDSNFHIGRFTSGLGSMSNDMNQAFASQPGGNGGSGFSGGSSGGGSGGGGGGSW